MNDLNDRLARLNDSADTGDAARSAVGDELVAADLRRGHRAFRRRTVRRTALGVTGLAAVAAVSVAVADSSSSPTRHEAAPTGVVSRPTSASHSPVSTRTSSSAPAVSLVAYRGEQKPGFTVAYVPEGYVLQGVSGSTLDIAGPDDHTPLDTFSGKLTVGIEEATDGQGLSAYHGRHVTIDGQPGIISSDESATILVFDEGHGSNNVVTVQSWSNIKLTEDQVVEFAKGVTVTADAQRQHG